MLTSDLPIGFQGRLPAHNDSPRLPFSSNDCQILGSRSRGCEVRQRQGLVIGCEKRSWWAFCHGASNPNLSSGMFILPFTIHCNCLNGRRGQAELVLYHGSSMSSKG